MIDVAKFLGTWRLVSWTIPDEGGVPRHPLGSDAKGLLSYAPDGYMFAALMASGRPRFLGGDPLGGTAEECRAATHGYHTYCGRYRLEKDAVVHTVELSLFPNLIGQEQVRYYRFDGDRLLLSTPPLLRNGLSGVAQLVWERVRHD
ncbi:MAG TPA: lipocalin-like domain-containing protein [Alphaproteobacteria bacterium]|nr:lipocalin-like domain-containing protein [Alphaproteobacteria bacterium]